MRLIDADALDKRIYEEIPIKEFGTVKRMARMREIVGEAPTVAEDINVHSKWISVKDRIPEEHDSLFAKLEHLSKHMWAKESDNVIVYVRFPDGTGRSTEGRLQDGKWWTRISPALEPVVTHWQPLPKSPEEEQAG